MRGRPPRPPGRSRPRGPARNPPAGGTAPAGGIGPAAEIGGPSASPTITRTAQEAESLHALGLSLLRKRNARGAVPHLERAVAASPAIGRFHETLARAYGAVGEIERAETECRLALRFDAKRDRAALLLGRILLERGETEAALEQFLAAIEANPPCLEGLNEAAVAFNRLGDPEHAAACCRRVLDSEPNNALAWTNLGMAHRGAGRREEAKEAFRRAGDLPLARFNLGYVHLQEDDLARGLPLLELRRKLLGIGRGLPGRPWTGGARPGKTLAVIYEQGIGDTILMSRFFPALLPLFRRVVVQAPRPLLRLMTGAFPAVRVVTDFEGVDFDYWCPTMSLPFVLGLRSTEEIPCEPWLRVEAAERSSMRPQSTRPRVGINWAGNPRFTYDAARSTRLESFELLLRVGEVDWVSLHKGHLEAEAERYGLPQPLRHANDFYDTALVLAGCDLVISTETAVPNLSAAMGIPTCVLTTPDPDWRWGSWYPNVKICRQEVAGNWFGAVAGALEAIRDLVAGGGSEEIKTAA